MLKYEDVITFYNVMRGKLDGASVLQVCYFSDWNSLAYQQTLQRLGKFVYDIFVYGHYYKIYMNVIYNFTKWPNQSELLLVVTSTNLYLSISAT